MLLYQASGLIIDYVTIIVASKCFSNITMDSLHESMVNVLLGVLSQTFLLVFLMILHRYVIHTSSDMLTEAEWLRFAIFPIFTIVVLISLLVGFEIPLNERQKSILICISIGLIGMNIVVFYLINSILKREMELRENKIFLERVKNETEMYRSISENYDKQRKREHEYQNHMQVISDLLKNKKYQELERFIDESNSDTAGKIDKIDTNHVIVNSILNTKYREAREKKIVFVVKVNDLSTLKIMPKKADDDKTTKVYSTVDGAKQAGGVLSLAFTQANKDMYVLDLGKTYDLSNYKGVALSGKATEQMSIELYPDTADFQQDKYWTKQVQFATYPFFEGSHAIRSYEGTSYGEAGVEENWWCNWIDGVDSKNVKVDGTTPKGNLTNVRYVVLKANKFDANKPEHVYELKSLVFSKDWKENTNPTDKEIKANPEKYPEYK